VVSEDLTKKRDENQEKEAAKLSDQELYERAKKVKSVGQRKVIAIFVVIQHLSKIEEEIHFWSVIMFIG